MATDIEAPISLLVTRKQAKEAGLRTYSLGKPCVHGHDVTRYVSSGGCVECAAIAAQKPDARAKRALYQVTHWEQILVQRAGYRRDNRPRVLAQKAGYRARNIDKCRAGVRDWCARNRRRCADAALEWYYAHRDEALANMALRYIANRESHLAACKRWRQNNPEAKRAHNQNRRARLRANGGDLTGAQILFLFKAQHGKCAYYAVCGNRLKNNKGGWHFDHVKSSKDGGPTSLRNGQLTCATCNSRKKAKDPLVFARQIGLLV